MPIVNQLGLSKFLRSNYKTVKEVFVTRKFKLFSRQAFNGFKIIFSLSCLAILLFQGCAQQHVANREISMDTKIGQMLAVGFRGLQADYASNIAHQISANHIGGVMLFDYDVPTDSAVRNIQSIEQVQKLTDQLQQQTNIPLLIAIDQEGGRVSRLKEKFGFPPTISAQYFGELNNVDSTRYYANQTAKLLQKLGINVNLAPVVDLNINPNNPVIGSLERSFSADPDIVTQQAEAYIKAMHKAGIITTLKHFPGHGSSKDDSHKGVVDVTQTWQKSELTPYRKIIKADLADIIMTAHIYNARLDSVHPATLSKPVIAGILRDSLNFDGVIMSDDLQMGAIRKQYGLKEAIKLSIQAGVDMLSFANNSVFDPQIASKAHRIIRELIDEGEISEERINQSYKRIMKLKKRMKN